MALSIKNAAKAVYVCATADVDGAKAEVFVDHGASIEIKVDADGISIKGDKAAWAAIASAIDAIYEGIEA